MIPFLLHGHLVALAPLAPILADPVTILAVTAATATVAAGVENVVQTKQAADAQKNLANQQEEQLSQESLSASLQARQQASTGATFGWGEAGSTFSTGLGFSQPQNTGFGRSSLTGGNK